MWQKTLYNEKRGDRTLRKIVEKDRFQTLGNLRKQWTESGVETSRATVHRRVQEMGYRCRIPQVKPLLNHKQRQRCLTWATEKQHWTVAKWSQVLFSDESKFCMSFGNQGARVWRKTGEKEMPKCLKSSVKYPQSVMVWGAMSAAGVGPLCFIKGRVNAASYQEILEHFMLPSAEMLYGDEDFIFQHDLAPAHSAKTTGKWFTDHGITVLNWPANSPDLNPIENLWDIVKRKLRDARPNTLDELKAAIEASWASITSQQCHRLIASMPRRIEAVISAKGFPTNYMTIMSAIMTPATDCPQQQYSGQEDYYGEQYSHGSQGPPEGMSQQYYPDGYIEGLSTAFQNAVDEPLMPVGSLDFGKGRAKYACAGAVAEDQKRTSWKEDRRRRSGPETPIRPDQQRDRPWELWMQVTGHNDYGYQQPSYPEQGYDRPYEDSSQHYYEGGNTQYAQQQESYQGPPQQGYPPHSSNSSTQASKVILASSKVMVHRKVALVLSTLITLRDKDNNMCHTDLHSQDPHSRNSRDLMDMIRGSMETISSKDLVDSCSQYSCILKGELNLRTL
ncbi:unnamed protein product [Ranitomeya imitator]|uniref:Transposase n=1 Tax=Ranitomeya imitator TaxID=111125 RepID=A0ABN9LT38_9NEOB|nr:unnamed protein product [Ranitomeya imitator]